MDNKTVVQDEFKTFYLDKIPYGVHMSWKLTSAMQSISMNEFAIEAIKEKIAREATRPNNLSSS